VSGGTDEFEATKTKKSKLNDKQKTILLLDLYQKTKLDRLEIFALEQELVLKGVKIERINPKSISKHELIGNVDSQSGLFNQGLLTSCLRRFQQDRSSLKKWIHLDGPLDNDWAENLNSLLDDN